MKEMPNWSREILSRNHDLSSHYDKTRKGAQKTLKNIFNKNPDTFKEFLEIGSLVQNVLEMEINSVPNPQNPDGTIDPSCKESVQKAQQMIMETVMALVTKENKEGKT